jgi:protein TonB
MLKKFQGTPDFNDIVFMTRNKNYGAYMVRKKYPRTVIISLFIGIIIMATGIILPFITAKSHGLSENYKTRQVEIKMEKLDEPNEIVVPPPPPPPPSAEIIKQTKYVAPVIIDSVKPQEATQFMTAEDAQDIIVNGDIADTLREVKKEEVQEEKEETEPFLVVQEMPEPPGGLPGLLKYISDHLVYPREAQENNIQGKVFVKFCVTETGKVNRFSIYKGVDPELDSAALKVVSTFPPFKPGKQAGKPVPVWYIVQINFQLN